MRKSCINHWEDNLIDRQRYYSGSDSRKAKTNILDSVYRIVWKGRAISSKIFHKKILFLADYHNLN